MQLVCNDYLMLHKTVNRHDIMAVDCQTQAIYNRGLAQLPHDRLEHGRESLYHSLLWWKDYHVSRHDRCQPHLFIFGLSPLSTMYGVLRSSQGQALRGRCSETFC